MTFGEKVKQLRTEQGLTQTELGKKLGLTKRTIIYYETDKTYPKTRERYQELADALNVDVSFLYTEDAEFLTDAAAKFGRRGQLQAASILDRTHQLFAGGSLSPEDEMAFVMEIQRLFLDSKEKAHEKFTPKKYRKEQSPEGNE